MRFITGGIMHETHTFSAEPTPESVWEIARGQAVSGQERPHLILQCAFGFR